MLIELVPLFVIAVGANGWTNGVFAQGKLGYDYIHIPYGQKLPDVIIDPMYQCAICVAGQWSLWYFCYTVYMYDSHILFWSFELIGYIFWIFAKILFTIGISAIINYHLE